MFNNRAKAEPMYHSLHSDPDLAPRRLPKDMAPANRTKTALVLSAGGVFGAYQAGVWKALAGSFTPDLVIGTSIGSVNGWLIASGCSPADIVDLWLNAGEALTIRPKYPRRWSHGVLNGESVEARLGDLCERLRPRIEFAVVLTDVRRLRPVAFSGPETGLRHLMASCAVPGAFDLERIDGRLYADGGLFGALPLWAAAQLGATRIVAVQAMPPPPLALRWAAKAVRRRMRTQQTRIETILIEPEKPLGSWFEILKYRRDRIERWIELGFRDGSRMKHSIPFD